MTANLDKREYMERSPATPSDDEKRHAFLSINDDSHEDLADEMSRNILKHPKNEPNLEQSDE